MKHYPSMFASDSERPSGKGRFIVGDTESKGLLPDLRPGHQEDMHIIVMIDVLTDEVFIFFDPYEARDPDARIHIEMDGQQDGYLMDGVKFILEAEGYAFHNATGFDTPAFFKLFGDKFKHDMYQERTGKLDNIFPFRCMDTYVLSTLLHPDRRPPSQAYALGRANVGPHSIEAHGIAMGRYKPEHEDWSHLSDDMIHRCVEDSHIGKDLLLTLMQGEWKDALSRKHKVTGLRITDAYRMEFWVALQMAWQAERGFRLDMQWCLDTWNELNTEIDATEAAFRPHMPMRLCRKKKSFDDWLKQVAEMRKWIEGNANDLPTRMLAWLVNPDVAHATRYSKADRASDLATQWKLTTAKGDYTSALRNVFPEMAGNKNDKISPLVVGPFSPIRFEDIPLGNRQSVKQVLYERGWLGVKYNETEQEFIDEHGEPEYPWSGKIDEPSLEAWKERAGDAGIPEWCEGIARWYILCSRRNQLLNPKDVEKFNETGEWPKDGCRGLMAQARCKEYGNMRSTEYYATYGQWPTDPNEEWAVPAVCIPIATNTFRARHKVVVNIPARGLYPLRRAFIARKGKRLLGIDGAGLELRMLAHFMNDQEYTDVVLSGDIHTHNQHLAGLPTRNMAKTFAYAVLYGSGAAHLAQTLGISLAEAKAAMDRFMQGLPSLANLITALEKVAREHGYVLAVDGRHGIIRRKDGELLVHTTLNVLLQMTGSLCMKWGLYFAKDELQEMLGEIPLLAFVHDEYQLEVDESEVQRKTYRVKGETEKDAWSVEEKAEHHDELGQWSAPEKVKWHEDTCELEVARYFHPVGTVLGKAFTDAGVYLGIRPPLAGEYKIGASWHDTH